MFNTNISYPSTRLRRNRKSEWSRKLVSENTIQNSNLIAPIFIIDGKNIKEPIDAMPGVERLTIDNAIKYIKELYNLGIQAVILFPIIDLKLKTPNGNEVKNQNSLIYRAIKEIKNAVPEIGIITDIALDPYTTHGHDGIIDDKGYVLNDETLEMLSIQALNSAKAGCDVVAPSDMMDGRIKLIRNILEANNFYNTQILAYSVKYASSFYGGFRSAIKSEKTLDTAIDKRNYQVDYANIKEAILEVQMDIDEGADMIIIKPGIMYIDIVKKISETFCVPIISYQVSGEYSMIKFAAKHGVVNEIKAFYEMMIAFKRSGCRAVITYAAMDLAKYINNI